MYQMTVVDLLINLQNIIDSEKTHGELIVVVDDEDKSTLSHVIRFYDENGELKVLLCKNKEK